MAPEIFGSFQPCYAFGLSCLADPQDWLTPDEKMLDSPSTWQVYLPDLWVKYHIIDEKKKCYNFLQRKNHSKYKR